MILRIRQTSPACIRCHTRFLGHLGGEGSRLRAPAPLSHPSLQALRSRRAHSTAPSDATETEPISEDAESADKEHKPLVRWTQEPLKEFRRPTFQSESEWTRNRHLNRANLQEKFAPVKVDSLGRPTSIVVLRENVRAKGPRYVRDKGAEIVIENEPLDILAEMQKDIGIAGAAEVIENIGSIRPSADKKRAGKKRTFDKTWEEIAELEKHLVQGFTKTQMLAYIQDFELRKQKFAEKGKDVVEEEVEEDKQPLQVADWLSVKDMELATSEGESTSHILSETPWMPGRSEHGDYFENSVLRGYTSDANTQKSKAAMFIIRSCWRIRAKEYESAIGEVELKLTPEDLELLIAPRLRDPPLKKISDALVSTENEKIEAYRARDVVRITGTPRQTNLIARAIENVLANIRTHKVSLAELKRRDKREFNMAVYEELEKLTNSEVIRLSKDMVAIKGMNLKPGSGLSTVADVARRVLLSSSDAADQSVRNVGLKITDKPAYAVEWPLQEGMSWRQKMRHWARWESPIEKPLEEPMDQKEYVMELDALTDSESSSLPKEAAAESHRPESELIPTFESETAASAELAHVERDALWHSTQRKSYAVIGNLLHEAVSDKVVDPKPVSFDMRDIDEERTLFVSHTRNLARLVDHLPALATKECVFMKFLPSPWTKRGGEALNAFPAVEMEFKRSKDQPLKLQGVYAISEDVHNDVMIPDRTLDLSFRQKTAFQIPKDKALAVPQINSFLKKSQLNPMNQEIVTPAELMLPIPSYICRNPGDMFENENMLTVPYLFAGLEFREYTTFDYHNWRLRYSSINGGKAAGQWSELALDYKAANSDRRCLDSSSTTETAARATETSDDILRSFTAAAFQLVDDLDTPRLVRVRMTEDTTFGDAEGSGVVRYEYLPSVRHCMIRKDMPIPQQFTCFIHRPLFSKEANEVDEREKEEGEESE